MILTVCISPSVDVTIEVDSLNIGQVNLVKSKSLSFTGKAINVAIGVSRLGYSSYATGFMYRDDGTQFRHALERENVPFSFVWNDGRVRENYKIIDKRSMLTEINDVGEHVDEDKLQALVGEVKRLSASADVTVISGRLPRGVDATYYRDLVGAVDPRSKKIVDTEGAKLFCALECGVDLVKPNLQELESTLGRQLKSREEILSGCEELIDRGAKAVLLSLGKEGAIITDGNRHYHCKSINVAVNSTVGAGDGMVAAASVKMSENADLPEVLRAGVAAGTATVMTFGKISFAKEKYNDIYSALTISKY